MEEGDVRVFSCVYPDNCFQIDYTHSLLLGCRHGEEIEGFQEQVAKRGMEEYQISESGRMNLWRIFLVAGVPQGDTRDKERSRVPKVQRRNAGELGSPRR